MSCLLCPDFSLRFRVRIPSNLARLFAVFAAGALALPVAKVRADVLANYTFETAVTPTRFDSTDADAQTTASAITLGTGLDTAGQRFGTLAGSAVLRINGDETTAALNNFAAATAAGDYFEFTLTPNSAVLPVRLTSLTFDLGTTAGLTTNVRVSYSIGGAAFAPLTSITGFNSTTLTPESVDLTGLGTVSQAAPIVFRFIIYDNVAAQNQVTGFDNIIVNGNVVPEPTTWVMATGGLLLLCGIQWVRRRRA